MNPKYLELVTGSAFNKAMELHGDDKISQLEVLDLIKKLWVNCLISDSTAKIYVNRLVAFSIGNLYHIHPSISDFARLL